VHTTLSDGGGAPDEVVRAAAAAGLGFLFLTEHNSVEARAYEGYRRGVLVLSGTEISTTGGHLLGLGLREPGYRFSGDPRDGFEDIRHLGGLGFAAHPTSDRTDFRFTGWDLPGDWGLEVLNGDSQWRAAGAWGLLRSAALYPLNHRYAMLRALTPIAPALSRWDDVLSRRDAPAVAGADAHGRLSLGRRLSLAFPSYEAVFGLARNHVLLPAPPSGQAATDGAAVQSALAAGRSYVGLDALAPADGFFFVARQDGVLRTMGESVSTQGPPRLSAGGRVPPGARVVLLRDGEEVAAAEGGIEHEARMPGVHRVEVRVPGWPVPWIVSNPIYVFDAPEAQARRIRAAWPDEPPAPPPAEILDSFDGPGVFEPARDPLSELAPEWRDATGGLGGTGAARLAFRLGQPTDERPHVYVALVHQDARDLSARKGMTLAVRGDGEHRLWVQVRDLNPASRDEGLEYWFASVRTSAEWRRTALPFTRFRSINPRTDGRLDLDKARAIVFLIDKGAAAPGTKGTVWLDEVGFY
jgi:hypothetical protein